MGMTEMECGSLLMGWWNQKEGRLRDGTFILPQEKELSIHLQDGTGNAFTAAIPAVAEPVTSAEGLEAANGVIVRAKVTGTWLRRSKEHSK